MSSYEDYSDGLSQEPPPMMPASEPEPRTPALGEQIKLNADEQRRILSVISERYTAAWEDNAARMELFKARYRRWRKKAEIPTDVNLKSNFLVPLVREKVLVKWAKTLDAFLGQDAEIVAQPTGPVDQAIQHKVSRYMTWLLFNKMDIVDELAKFTLQEIIFGRAHAECIHDVDWLYDVKDGRYSKGAKTLWYEGPRFRTLPPYCFVVPPSTDERDPNDFEWVAIRYWKSPDKLYRDEQEGYCVNVKENIERIYRHAADSKPFDSREDAIRKEQAEFEGVVSDYGQSEKNAVECRKVYMRWRMLKNQSRDAEYDNYKQRDLHETELVLHVIPDLRGENGASAEGLIISCQNLAELYPLTKKRRPIVTASLLKDGSYWSPGLVELLEELEIEKSANLNLMNDAGELTVSPPIFAVPGMGLSEERTKIEPGMIYWTQDPKSVNQMQIRSDWNFNIARDQMLEAMAEGVSGITASNAGRSSDRPNQPRTFRGQALLLGQSDIRQSLETMFMGEDWSKILDHIKMLVDTYAAPEEEFRVTEEAASGYFETNKGFAKITAQERSGRYDFKLKFATSSQSREARKERLLAFMQIAAPMPIFIQNPNLQRDVLKVAVKELDLEGILPALTAVPDANVPETPQVEWTKALQGIDPAIHLQDDDNAHITDHYSRIMEQMKLPQEQRDTDAVNRMIAHIMQHVEQQKQKQLALQQAQAQANAAMLYSAMSGEGDIGGGNGQAGLGQGAGFNGQGIGQILSAQTGIGNGGTPGAGEQLAGFPGAIGGTDLAG